jgi:carboxypeptidase C (cathepsin A)
VIVLIRKSFRPLVLGAFALILAISPVAAQRSEGAPPEARATSGVLSLLPAKDSVTEHTVDAGGEKLAYTATAGTLSLFDQSGERSAAIFYTAYTLKGAPAETRPVTFVFNGGPGASSAYLHLGLVGPQVADFGPARDGSAAQLRNNPDTWLKFTDLVMIDPVGTGWSRAAKQDKSGDFWGVQSDAQSLAKVIALYAAKNSRTASPKYLLGESYGGFRAVKVARALQQGQGIVVSGIVMVSPFVDGGIIFGGTRYALGAALQLPSLAAAELDRRNAFAPEALAAAERFAMTDYLVALAGRPPEGESARAFYARVSEMTGLPVDEVTRARGFIRDLYSKRAREGRGEVVSPYDGASSSPDPFPESASEEGADYILDGYLQALGGLFVGYARDQLGFKTEMTYNVLNREVSGKWDWGGHGGRGQASIARDLRELLALNPGLRVLVAHGRSDLVTPYGVTRYLLDHMPQIGADNRTQLKLYKGGHMHYLDVTSRAAFTADAAAFYRRPVL